MNNSVKTAFIVGTGRCGTSWLGQMLNSHAEICVPPEIQLLFEYSGNGNRLAEAFSLAAPSGLEGSTIAKIIEQGCPHKLEMFFDYHEFCSREDTPRGSLREFVTAFYSAIARDYGKSWLVEQTPWYGSRLDLLSRFFPEAKVIHMIRDGRDVALSFARTPWWHRSPRLNLARWQREIKKIVLDASVYLNEHSYLEVKYEDLVSNTELEMRRICAFLGVNFDLQMLDPKEFIDYDQFCKFDMQQISSHAYNSWHERRDVAVFTENVQAWRRTAEIFHSPLPGEVEIWLKHYGYEVGVQLPDGLDITRYHQEYDFNAIEALQSSQLERIHELEKALQIQAEQSEPLMQDWIARGKHIEQLAQTIEILQVSSQKQAEQTESITHDWTARGEHIEHLAQALEVLQCSLQKQSEQTESITQDWTARGKHIEHLAQAIETLQGSLQKQIEQTESVTQDWTARGEHIEHIVKTIESHRDSLQKQAEQTESITQDWAARGEHIEHLAKTIEVLRDALQMQAEQTESITQNWTARGEHIIQLECTIVALQRELGELKDSWCARLNRMADRVRIK